MSKTPGTMVVNSLRATEREWQAWDTAARLVRLTRSEWMRHVLALAADDVIMKAITKQTGRKTDGS